jgi:hypothetical protein
LEAINQPIQIWISICWWKYFLGLPKKCTFVWWLA